eukprot:1160422-Pelagomonas_calceolata.AAC.11
MIRKSAKGTLTARNGKLPEPQNCEDLCTLSKSALGCKSSVQPVKRNAQFTACKYQGKGADSPCGNMRDTQNIY